MSAWPICGFATCYGEPVTGRAELRREQFARWESDQWAAHLKLSHDALIMMNGTVIENLGRAVRFKSVDYPPVSGLLCFALLDDRPETHFLRDAITAGLSDSTAMPWCLSIGVYHYGGRPGEYGIEEVSLTLDPAIESALVLAVGDQAASAWELLTGEPAPTEVTR